MVLEVVPHKASIDSSKDTHEDQEAYNRAHSNASNLALAEATATACRGRWGRAGSADLSTACVCHGAKPGSEHKGWVLQATYSVSREHPAVVVCKPRVGMNILPFDLS